MRISDWSSDVCSSDLRRHWLGYLLLAPAVALIALIIIYPLFVSLDLSFQNVASARLDQPRKAFTLANYERLFTSPAFWSARSDERRVGHECVRPCSFRWSPYHSNKQTVILKLI